LFIALCVVAFFSYTYFSFERQVKKGYVDAVNSKEAFTISQGAEYYYANQAQFGAEYIVFYLTTAKREFYFQAIDTNKKKLNVKISDNLNVDFYKHNDKQNLIVYNYKNHSTKYLLSDDWGFWDKIKKVRD
jgi:predicted Zn-dependent protease